MKIKYWMCIIKVEIGQELPAGFDGPPRQGAVAAIEMRGIRVLDCWSGWGLIESRVNKIMKLWNTEK